MKKGLVALVLLSLIFLFFNPLSNVSEAKEEPKPIYVNVVVSGNVIRPDTYYVPKGIELETVLEIAGLKNDSVYYSNKKIVESNLAIEVKKRVANPLDLNKAKESEIKELPGVGKVTLNKIMSFLKTKSFKSWDEFSQITGLKNDKLLEIMVRAVIR